MQCDVCQQNPATVFLTQILKGELQKVNLCEACSKAKGVTDPTGFALAEMLWGLGTTDTSEVARERTCPACKLSQSIFRKSGRLGCSMCYQTFRESINHLLKAMHKGVQWVEPSTPVKEIAKLMRDYDIGAIPIGENDKLIGMVTDRDLVCRGLAQFRDANALTHRCFFISTIGWCCEILCE